MNPLPEAKACVVYVNQSINQPNSLSSIWLHLIYTRSKWADERSSAFSPAHTRIKPAKKSTHYNTSIVLSKFREAEVETHNGVMPHTCTPQ